MTLKEFLEKYPMVQESDLISVAFYHIGIIEEANEEIYHSEEDQKEEESWKELYDSETLEDDDDAYMSFNNSILSQSRFYIIASTSFYMSETYYFPSTDGINHTSEELACSMALRYGHNEFDNEDEISRRLSEHFPGYLIEKKDTFNIDSDMGHIVKRVYSLSKLA